MTSPNQPIQHDPISTLGKSLGKEILIKCKRYKIFKGNLKSYDAHLNVLLEDVTYTYYERDDEDHTNVNPVQKTEKLNKIVLRGDSIVFVGLAAD